MKTLSCREKILCRLIGVPQSKLEQNIKQPIGKDQLSQRLLSLSFVVRTLAKRSPSPADLYRSITIPCFPLADDTFLCVVAGLHMDLPPKVLLVIATHSLNRLQSAV